MRKAFRFFLLVLSLGFSEVASSAEAAGHTTLRVRDIVDGAPLQARMKLYRVSGPLAASRPQLDAIRHANPDSELTVGAAGTDFALQGRLLALISAPGYVELATLLEPGSAGWTVWLKPLHESSEAHAETEGGIQHISGTVRDSRSLNPVAGARLELRPAGLVTYSDVDGRYRFLLDPESPHLADSEFLHLSVAAAGWPSQSDPAIPRRAGNVLRNVDLGAGPAARHRHQDTVLQMLPESRDETIEMLGGSSVDDPPLSIRVGFADASCSQTCCTGSCTHTCVFDLETYVRRGITHEWIGSWTQQSLRAGSIAYRSYAAWHALNPVAGRPYDLCSSACCQVSGGSVSNAGTLAARATAGLLLKRNEAVFRSEYSAENNCLLGAMSCSNADLSCGNGYAGSPATNWPCLEDVVGLNRSCFGHGRGMSQWGTQRWSQTPHLRLWPWIVNHYYNASGTGTGLRSAVMTRVLAIQDAAPEPSSLEPGESFDIVLDTLNRAVESHQQVLVGASIRRASEPFISDPARDQLIELPPGSSLATRSFVVPEAAEPGSYALWVSLYIDIDGDGAISSDDLVQALLQLPDALQVQVAVPPPDALFGNGFEAISPP